MAKLLGHMHQPKPNYLYWSGAKLVSVSWTLKKVDSRQLKCPFLRQLQHLRLFVWGTSNSPFLLGDWWILEMESSFHILYIHSGYRDQRRILTLFQFQKLKLVEGCMVLAGFYLSTSLYTIYPLWLVFPMRNKYPQTISRFWYHIDSTFCCGENSCHLSSLCCPLFRMFRVCLN